MSIDDSNGHRALIDAFPRGAAGLAAEVGAPVGTVYVWKSRGRIPAARWNAVEAAARRIGVGVVLDESGLRAPAPANATDHAGASTPSPATAADDHDHCAGAARGETNAVASVAAAVSGERAS